MRLSTWCVRAVLLVAIVLSVVREVAAQDHILDPGRAELSREQLQRLLSEYDQAANSSAYSAVMQRQARAEGALLRARLEQGDFQVGDQITLLVEGEEQLSKLFVVQDGPSLLLPAVGTISLRGVLRSELEERIRTELGRFLKDPVVHAQSSIRILVMGGVGKAGYYVFPTSTIVTDALMAAGGPVSGAKLTEIRVERGGERIWDGEPMQRAIVEGRTLDQLSIRAGDHLVVPVRSQSKVRTVLITVPSLILAVVSLTRLF